MAKEKFYVEGMTVQQILNINPRDLMKLGTRDISRALRTVALAANKRINRLKQYAKKTKGGYISKGIDSQIATDALNWVTRNGKIKTPFGVKQAETRNQMLKQISDIKKFMGMRTSTVKGAVQVRREREQRLFGKTREQAGKGQSKKEKKKTYERFAHMHARVWELYYKFAELNGMDPHAVWEGSEEILEIIGNGLATGKSDEEIINEALNRVQKMYQEQQDEYHKIFGDDWENFGSFNWE